MEREIGSDRIQIVGGPHNGREGTILRRWTEEAGAFIEVAMDSGERVVIQGASSEGPTFRRETGS